MGKILKGYKNLDQIASSLVCLQWSTIKRHKR